MSEYAVVMVVVVAHCRSSSAVRTKVSNWLGPAFSSSWFAAWGARAWRGFGEVCDSRTGCLCRAEMKHPRHDSTDWRSGSTPRQRHAQLSKLGDRCQLALVALYQLSRVQSSAAASI